MNTSILVGDYRNHQEVKSILGLSLTPSNLMPYWGRCSLMANIGASFLTGYVDATQLSYHTISMVLNELIENAAHYSVDHDSEIQVLLFEKHDGRIRFEVRNTVDIPRFRSLLAYSRALTESLDIDSMFHEKVLQLRLREGHSGLGLLTLMKDLDVRLSFRFTHLNDHQYRVSAQTHMDAEEV